MRTAAVRPVLERKHAMRVSAGRDAHAILGEDHDDIEIPVRGTGADRKCRRAAPERAIVNMGVGEQAALHWLSPSAPGAFIEESPTYAKATAIHRRAGLGEALKSLTRFISEMAGGRRPQSDRSPA